MLLRHAAYVMVPSSAAVLKCADVLVPPASMRRTLKIAELSVHMLCRGIDTLTGHGRQLHSFAATALPAKSPNYMIVYEQAFDMNTTTKTTLLQIALHYQKAQNQCNPCRSAGSRHHSRKLSMTFTLAFLIACKLTTKLS